MRRSASGHWPSPPLRRPLAVAALAGLGVLSAPSRQAAAATAMAPPPAAAAVAPSVTPRLSTVTGRLWLDLDGNGLQGRTEPPAADVEVRLLEAGSRQLVASQHTTERGAYRFSDLSPATYVLEVRLPAGRGLSPRDVGDDDHLDSDFAPESGRSDRLELAPGAVVEHLDGGLRVVPIFVEGFETGDLSKWSTGGP